MNIEGKWHVVYSTFPKWKKGGIKDITFNYTRITKDGQEYLLDEVKYTRNGNAKSIKGYDTPNVNSELNFTWRGKGWLMWFSSKWEVIWTSPDEHTAVIYFEKTLVSPAGLDIISRDKMPNNKVLGDALIAVAGGPHGNLRHKLYRITF